MNQPPVSAIVTAALFEAFESSWTESRPAAGLAGRCTARVVFRPSAVGRGPVDTREVGCFVADADSVAQALTAQFPPSELLSEDTWAAVLYRWLRDHDRHDDSLTTLPDCSEIATAMEQTFQRAAARAFCVCCNRNYLRPHTRFLRRPEGSRYVCPEGHLLLSIGEEENVPAANLSAAA